MPNKLQKEDEAEEDVVSGEEEGTEVDTVVEEDTVVVEVDAEDIIHTTNKRGKVRCINFPGQQLVVLSVSSQKLL